MLEVSGLEFEYPENPLLAGVSFRLNPGDLLHLRGANGTGKTTLLRLIAGIFYPANGKIRYQGSSIYHDLVDFQKKICFVGHKSGMHPMLTVKENIQFDLKNHNNNDSLPILKMMAMADYGDHLLAHLSAGQKRRLSLLRLFLSKASIWLLDEPFVALDVDAMDVLMEKIRQHRQNSGMIVLTSHQLLPLQSHDYLEYRL